MKRSDMEKQKQWIKILLLFMLLLFIAAAPLILADGQSDRLMNKVVLSPNETDDQSAEKGGAFQGNMWERIKCIRQFSDISVKTETDTVFFLEQAQEELIRTMEEQMNAIERYHALPHLDFTAAQRAESTKMIYWQGDSQLESGISAWNLWVEYPSFSVSAHMDAESSALYEVTILFHASKKTDVIFSSDMNKNGFFQYLNSFSKEDPMPKGGVTVKGEYTKKRIHLELAFGDEKETRYGDSANGKAIEVLDAQ